MQIHNGHVLKNHETVTHNKPSLESIPSTKQSTHPLFQVGSSDCWNAGALCQLGSGLLIGSNFRGDGWSPGDEADSRLNFVSRSRHNICGVSSKLGAISSIPHVIALPRQIIKENCLQVTSQLRILVKQSLNSYLTKNGPSSKCAKQQQKSCNIQAAAVMYGRFHLVTSQKTEQ